MSAAARQVIEKPPPTTVQDPAELGEVLQERRRKRIIYFYDVPESCRTDDYLTIGMIELTAQEELDAGKLSGNNPAMLSQRLVLSAFVAVNGKPLNKGEGEDEEKWGAMPPKIRSLVVAAYSDIHQPRQEEQKSFLASRRAKVG